MQKLSPSSILLQSFSGMFFQIIYKITELESFLNDGYNPAEKNFSKIRAQCIMADKLTEATTGGVL